MLLPFMLTLLLAQLLRDPVEASPPPLPLLYPRFHLTMPNHWAQDPSGPILIGDTWHLFADSIKKGHMRGLYWAHAISQDLVNWVPSSDFETGSGSTGSVVPVENASSADGSGYTFHSIDGFASHHVATNSSLKTWLKMPFIGGRYSTHTGDPAGLFRIGDPSRPFRFGDEWLMIVGGGANGGNGTYAAAEARLYRAENYSGTWSATPDALSNWSYVGIAFSSNRSAPNPNSWGPWNSQNPTTGMFECIDFFRIGTKWMLMTSQISEGKDAFEGHPQKLTEAYWIGDFDGRKFTPIPGYELGRAVDYGFVAAAKTGGDLHNREASSRRVFFGWLDVWTRFHGATKYIDGNWKQFSTFGSVTQPFGSQTLPRDLWLDPDDQSSLRMSPVPELQRLRKRGPGNECHIRNASIVESGWLECSGRQIELNASVHLPNDFSEATVTVLASGDATEMTVIRINATMLSLDRTNSSLTPDATGSGDPGVRNWFPQNRTVLFAPLKDATIASGAYNLRVYIDGSALEIFVNERVSLTGLVFPTLHDAVHIGTGGSGLESLDVWLLSHTSPLDD